MSRKNKIIAAAGKFLGRLSNHRNETELRRELDELCEAFDPGTTNLEYLTTEGPADIYLPNQRTFFEVKRRGRTLDPDKPQPGNNESPKEQGLRYLRAERERERGILPLDNESRSERPWTLVVTNGYDWYAWQAEHDRDVETELGKITLDGESRDIAGEIERLCKFLEPILSRERVGRPWVPIDPGDIFRENYQALKALDSETPPRVQQLKGTKQALWLDRMRASGIEPLSDDFVRDTFLIAVVRFVQSALTPDSSRFENEIRDSFAAWVLDFQRGRNWARELHEKVRSYDWRRRSNDVLRNLHHAFVEEGDRKVYGEFYTPDWLARMLVEEVLDDDWCRESIRAAQKALAQGRPLDGVGVLDPACGSGTFLYHAVKRLLEHPEMRDVGQPGRQADVCARLVNGLDIHPIAVEISRVNILRALPTLPSEGRHAIRVHLGDSLQARDASKRKAVPLFTHTSEYLRITSPRGHEAHVPMAFVDKPSFAEEVGRLIEAAKHKRPLPADLEDVPGLEALRAAFAKIIEKEGNSVWTWHTVNAAAVQKLNKHKVNRILANPPWVKLADIQVPKRKQEMEVLGGKLGVHVGGKQAPHTDIAAYFILRTRDFYLKSPESDPAAWVVKKSALRGGNWAAFREAHKDDLAQSLDLEKLQPFGGGDARRTCVLFERRASGLLKDNVGHIEAHPLEGSKPGEKETWENVREKIEFRIVPDRIPQEPSGYGTDHIFQGATVVPHVLTLIEAVLPGGDDGRIRVRTRRSQQGIWQQVSPQEGEIPARWKRPLWRSEDLYPFFVREPAFHAIIPVDENGQLDPAPEQTAAFWRQLDEIYETHAGKGKDTPKTLLDRIDFQRILQKQLVLPRNRARRLVLHPGSGDIMRAARKTPHGTIIDSTLFRYLAATANEAAYLVCILNAPCLRQAFSESRESGRDFNLHPWRKVPIARYDKNNPRHARMAALCPELEKIAAAVVAEELEKNPQAGQVKASSAVRERLEAAPEGQEANEIVRQLLPDQARDEN